MAEEDKCPSQLDFGGVLRSAHDDKNHALRVTSANTSVPSKYSRVALTYNDSNSVTKAKFYLGTLAEERHITFKADVAGSLNNTYFTLYTENNESLYHVWYNVDNTGVDPAPLGSCGIEIPIVSNDPASIVKLSTQKCLELFCDDFRVQELAPAKLKITNARMGEADNTTDGGTGFTILTNQDGVEKLIKSIIIPFDGKARYVFNEQEKKFVVTSFDACLNGPSAQTTLTVDDATVQEVKVGATSLSARGVVTLQASDGKIYVYFGDGVTTPSTATVIADGIEQPRRALRTYEAGPNQPLYILAISGTVNVKTVERS